MSQVYDVILADPPWPFKVWNKDTGSGRSAEAHYPTMSLDDICNLPIKQLAAKNCVLFMWAVYPSLFDAEKVIKAWGFEYKTLGFEWWKLNKKWSNALGDFSEYITMKGILLLLQSENTAKSLMSNMKRLNIFIQMQES